jgi:DNA-binding NarL/FixJ family response regulator
MPPVNSLMTSLSTLELERIGLLQADDALPPSRLRILLAHGHAIVREGTRRILETDAGCEVLGETVSLVTALPLLESLKPDILVLGLDSEQLESRAYVKQLRSVLSRTRTLVLNDAIPPQRLARLGVASWIATTASPVEVLAGVRATATGHSVTGEPTRIATRDGGQPGHPTARELEVLSLVERGLTTRAIADRLHTTTRTIHFHVGNLFVKLGASSRTEMVHLARRRGWLE